MDATAQAELVRKGEVSPAELVDEAIGRIEALNPQLNAVIHEQFEQGRAEAASPNLPDGPFKGVPFLFKDLGAAYAGQPLHLGMKLLKDADFRAPVDTTLAQRFRAAGFIVVGKTNTPELGILPTTEPEAYGPSRNPWDTARTTGGSSGGSGAAVASGMVSIAHANDGGGSIRIPASECGPPRPEADPPADLRGAAGRRRDDRDDHASSSSRARSATRPRFSTPSTGPAPGDPYVAPAPLRPYVEELERGPGQAAHRLRPAPAGAGTRVRPRVRRRASRRPRSCSSRSATRSRTTRRSTRRWRRRSTSRTRS